MVFDQDAGTHAQRFMKLFVATAFNRTGYFFRVDLQTGIEAATDSDRFLNADSKDKVLRMAGAPAANA